MDSVRWFAPEGYWASSCGEGNRVPVFVCRTRRDHCCSRSHSNRKIRLAETEPVLAEFDAITQPSLNGIDFLPATAIVSAIATEISSKHSETNCKRKIMKKPSIFCKVRPLSQRRSISSSGKRVECTLHSVTGKKKGRR